VYIPSCFGGLNQDSVLLCEQIRVIDKKRIIKILGYVDNFYLEKIDNALSIILGLEK